MKELSIEDKAQRYDEAIEFAHNKHRFSSNLSEIKLIEELFPELKEDEREIPISEQKSAEEYNITGIGSKNAQGKLGEMIKRKLEIEKQCEQKPVSNTLKEAFDKSKTDYSLEEKKEASDYSESIIPTSVFYGESEEEYMLHKIIEAAFIAGQNNKHQSAWSEEDKERYLSCLRRLSTGNIEQPETVNTVWLKSIKDRVQPKQELSEDTRHWIDAIIKDYEELYSINKDFKAIIQIKINILKSLKDRCFWKPSESDILLLERITNGKSNPQDFQTTLGSLIEQLKKLSDE